ncbi:FAD-dependent oxidoreductase [Actinosynnema sp. CS-041913]|uniref:FAD-dependent oxidoreductase n=1 Tax=Actinosynnema sp. CS-041913 TaxID=3239917 RepID=UPI003D8B8374
MRVVVVGAGLGGLTLAHGLRRAGIDVVVHERDGARGRRQGVSLHLDDRGTEALRACLPPAHLAMVDATTGGPRERTLALSEVDGRLTVVRAQPYDGTTGPARPGRQVDRSLLRAVLLTGLEDAVRFGAEFTRFEERADGAVRAWFADGSTDTADVLVGADGIGSAVRRQHLPHVRVVDTGKRTLMGATPLRAVAGTGLPDLIGHSATTVQVRGTMMVLGVLRFTQPPVAARDRWLPDLRSPVVADAEDYVMWALPVTQDRLGPAGSPTAVWRRARELTADLHPTLRLVVDEAWPEVTVALRGGTIPAMPAWPAGPVTVLGDAIHLAPGFGGNLAMRDAHRLREALVHAARGKQDLITAIGAYEDAMRRDSFPATGATRLEPAPGGAREPLPADRVRGSLAESGA